MNQFKIITLKWDSSFFGYPVGELNFTDDLPALIFSLRQAQAAGYKLVYLKSETEISIKPEPETFFSIGVIDKRITYQKKLTPEDGLQKPAASIKPYTGAKAGPELLQLAFISGTYSRFAQDPYFKFQEYEKLYTEWINKSVSGELADVVLINTTPTGQPTGLITLKNNLSEASIGLLAVSPAVQGQGIGTKLLQAACYQAATWGCSFIRVGTQQLNFPANQLYQKAGFTANQSIFIYHIWL